MKDKVFATIKINNLGKCNVLNFTFKHYWSAYIKSGGDNSVIIKYIMLELLEVNGEKITEDMLNEIEYIDVINILEVLNAMTNNEFKIT